MHISGNKHVKKLKIRSAKKNRFTSVEDELLIDLVNEYGDGAWHKIAKHFENRSPRQCKERYFNYLQCGLNKEPWTSEEEKLLLKQLDLCGNQWSKIARSFKGRAAVDLKNHYNLMLRREARSKKQKEVSKNPSTQKVRQKKVSKQEQVKTCHDIFDTFDDCLQFAQDENIGFIDFDMSLPFC